LNQGPESYVVNLDRRHALGCYATVSLLREGSEGPVELVTVRALTRRGAKRRAARFIAARSRLAVSSG
jgi:hypothetical protein